MKKGMRDSYLLMGILALTLMAGAINVYAIKVLSTPLTHHTGNLSNMAIALFENSEKAAYLFGVIVCFFFGSAISGFFHYSRSANLTLSYSFILLFGGFCFVCMNYWSLIHLNSYLISFWIGMQNGMFLSFRKLRVRMSHMTGTLTDAGFAFGAMLRGQKEEAWKVIYLISNILLFSVGGILGFWINYFHSQPSLIFAYSYFLLSLYFFFLKKLSC